MLSSGKILNQLASDHNLDSAEDQDEAGCWKYGAIFPESLSQEEKDKYIAELKTIFIEKNISADKQEIITKCNLDNFEYYLNYGNHITEDNYEDWLEAKELFDQSLSRMLNVIVGIVNTESDYLELKESMAQLPLAKKINGIFANKILSLGIPVQYDSSDNDTPRPFHRVHTSFSFLNVLEAQVNEENPRDEEQEERTSASPD